MTNVIENAIKYTPSGGSVSINLQKEKQSGIIAIKDTGIGISKEKQEKIFDRFYRIDTARQEKGYGLGLSIAQQIIKYHNGTITLSSREGYGSTFTLHFPLIKQSQERNQS